jgi:hypothetical protein
MKSGSVKRGLSFGRKRRAKQARPEPSPYGRNLVLMMITQLVICIYQFNMQPFYARHASENKFKIYGLSL